MTTAEVRVAPGEWEAALADVTGYQVVVAGPGTGKSEFLVRRVEKILSLGLARRDQIAVVCFSRRAAADIRVRIKQAVGATGTRVDATTFHSLALRLLEVANPGGSRVLLTTPEQVGLVGDVLADENPEDWPLTYRGILTTHAFAAEVADFLMRCSERLLTPDDIEQRAAERADWKGLPGLYGHYLARLERAHKTDYGVLLTSGVALLETEKGQDLASAYHYVLVDEYQDTSPAQARMASLLAAPRGNLTVAGDPYQSVYSFRGAELRNIARFQSEYPESKRLVLTPSLRVPAEVLESAVRVVSPGHLPGEAGEVEPAPHQGRVDAYLFDQETAEAEWIAREVERAIRVEGVSPSSIAVLVRTKKELVSELSRALQRRGIPHDPPDARLVDHPAVRMIHDLVTVATSGGALPSTSASEAADADRAMRRILLGPLVGLTLSKERELVRRRRRTWAAWSTILKTELDDQDDLSALLGKPGWAAAQTAADGFWTAWSGLKAFSRLVEDSDRVAWRKAWTAFGQQLDAQADRDPTVTLERFFALVDSGDYEASPLLSHHGDTDGVTLTTLHQAKGLEFDLVFIANAVEGVFPDLRRGRRMLRPELLSPERTTDPHAQHLFQLQEEMRLAYTAMTRARLRVVWTATGAGIDQGESRPSRFLIAAAGVSGIGELGAPRDDTGDPVTLSGAEIALRRDLSDASAPAIRRLVAAVALANPDQDWWDPMVFAGVAERGPDSPIIGDSLRLSPSQADSYNTCPRRYALERRLRLGDAASPYAQFGLLVHEALEIAERQVVGTGRQNAGLTAAIEAVEAVWAKADFGTEELDKAWKAQAIACVTNLYEKWPHRDGEPVDVERIVESDIGGVRWVGKIDRLEQTAAGLRVVDYKTSRNAITKAEASGSIQLAYYADAVATDDDVVAAEMWYPRARTQALTTRELDLASASDIRDLMERITADIQAERWDARPGKHCERCDFRGSCPAWPEGRGAFLP